MHYVVYPKCLGPVGRYLGELTVAYNQRFRYLFVNTIAAQTAFWRMMTKGVLVGTELTFRMEQLLGLNNVAFFAMLAVGQALLGAPHARPQPASCLPPPGLASHLAGPLR